MLPIGHRHNEPYDKLPRTVRTKIDKAARSALDWTISRPLDRPKPARAP